MSTEVLVQIIQLIGLYIAMTFVYGQMIRMTRNTTARLRSLTKGCYFGLLAVCGMTIPLEFSPGLLIDARTTIISLSGHVGGVGAAAAVDELTVTWPGGQVQRVAVPGVDRVLRVVQEAAP